MSLSNILYFTQIVWEPVKITNLFIFLTLKHFKSLRPSDSTGYHNTCSPISQKNFP